MKGSKQRLFAFMGGVAAALVLFTGGPAKAIKLEASPDYFVDIRALLQPWIVFDNNPTSQTDLATDFYMRRTRIMLGGQVSKWVSFFLETDQPNWGRGGNWAIGDGTNEIFIQDAYVTLDFHEAFKVDVGMLLIPFIHQSRQGATSLHTLDYHAALIKYPAGSHKVWRDNGVEFRGLVFDKKLSYHLAVTNGVGGVNDFDDVPRFSGRIAYNAFDAEDAFFLGGTYFGKKKVLSFGFAFDTQPDAFNDRNTYYAFGADVFFDIPFGKQDRLSGQAAYVYYGHDDNPDKGQGLLFDIGYAFGPFEPLLALDWWRPNNADEFKAQLLGIHAGFNWWFKEHNANVKLDFGLIKGAGLDFEDASRVVTIQTQVLL